MTEDDPQSPLAVLRRVFGYSSFRGEQQEIVEHVTAGGDAIVLMPTGGGKSLCYQLPALLRPGLGVVVSPLIALMKDQVDALRQAGVRAAALNSGLPPGAAGEIERTAREGHLDLLYISPERLVMPHCLDLLRRCRIALFAIDEAHCISQWGHDFRRDYQALGLLKEQFPDIPLMALTATADDPTRRDIATRLHLDEARLFAAGYDRPNLFYRVVEKRSAREDLLRFLNEEHRGDAGIVYCLTRRSVEETAAWLSERGREALPYHAGLPSEKRAHHQERFLREEGLIVVATVAFGMGIDKPNVRFVAHLDAPKNLEAYYQETGRAGRDGLPADAWMAYGMADVMNLRRLTEAGDIDEQQRRIERQKSDALVGFCETIACRRQALLGYFGERHHEPCGNCDNCRQPAESWDGTVAAQKALSAVYRTGQRFGAHHLADVLTGNATDRVKQLGHDKLKTFGVGTECDAKGWSSVIRQLLAQGHLQPDPEGHGGLMLAPSAGEVLRGARELRFRREQARTRRAAKASAAPALDPTAESLWQELRAWRLDEARRQELPPYVIFHDATLIEVARRRPATLAALADIPGIGRSKLDRYGTAVLAVTAGQVNLGDIQPKGTAMRPQAAALKALLDEPRLQIMPGCGDGMGARLIEEAGFRTAFVSGSSVSAMRLAMPDMDLVGFAEMLDTVETCIAAAPKVLWLADGDTGHGNALAVQKTIRAYARRGAAAVLIEDKAWPRPLGHNGAKLVVDREAAILRCRAAVEACRDEGILLLARTDARISRGFDEALARTKAFVAEGADILFLDSPQSEEEMRAGIEACNGKPALAVTSPAGKHFMPGDPELQRIGIRIVVYPQEILAATVHAIRAVLTGLKSGAKPPMASPAELATAIRSADYLALDGRWPDPR